MIDRRNPEKVSSKRGAMIFASRSFRGAGFCLEKGKGAAVAVPPRIRCPGTRKLMLLDDIPELKGFASSSGRRHGANQRQPRWIRQLNREMPPCFAYVRRGAVDRAGAPLAACTGFAGSTTWAWAEGATPAPYSAAYTWVNSAPRKKINAE